MPTIALGRWMRRIRPLPIAQLELAFTLKKVDSLLVKWDANEAIRKIIYIDFAFIPCYTAVAWVLCGIVGDRRFGIAALVAGALDACVENPVMLLELDGQSNAFLTFVKATGSLIKWLILLTILVYLAYEMENG